MKLIADGYGTSADELWQKVIDEPNLAVVEGQILGTHTNPDRDFLPFSIEGPPFYDDDTMTPVEVEVRDPKSGAVVKLDSLVKSLCRSN